MNNNIIISESITFNELANILGTVKMALKTPTPKKLRESAGEPITYTQDGIILVYANGYAVYDNDSGKAAVWRLSCYSARIA